MSGNFLINMNPRLAPGESNPVDHFYDSGGLLRS